MKSSNPSPVVFITGASSGIGAALAKYYLLKGHRVAGFARRADRLANFVQEFEGSFLALPGDVTKPEDLKHAVEQILIRWGQMDIVYANAGSGISGPTSQLSVEDFRRQLEVNVFGVLQTYYTTRDALEKSKGRLAIIGSVMSYVSFGGSAPYAMSKFAVRALAEAFYHELKSVGISVTLICPGFIESEIRQVDNSGVLHGDSKDPIPNWLKGSSVWAARTIARAVHRRRRERILTLHAHLGVWLSRFFPSLLHWALRKFKIVGGKQKAIRS